MGMKKFFIKLLAFTGLLSLSTVGNLKALKDWNFMGYFAANNNLNSFSYHNMKQMAAVGSNDKINMLIQLDGLGNKQVKRFYINKNNPTLISMHNHSNATTSGTSASLYNFVEWSVKNYPAKHQCLVLWNHGSGIKDPNIWGRVLMSHRHELFKINPATGLLELDRTPITTNGYSDFATQRTAHLKFEFLSFVKAQLKKRGIAFNDSYEEYLTNQDLTNVLNDISNNLLGGKKIDIVLMDACHMAMAEVGSQIRSSTNFLVASEEVEPGSGHNYINLLQPFQSRTFTPREFAIHAVNSYKQEYAPDNADYTQSAVDLTKFENLEIVMSNLAKSLESLVTQRDNYPLKKIIHTIRRDRKLTTSFYDADYIDLTHLFASIKSILPQATKNERLSSSLTQTTQTILNLIDQGNAVLNEIIINNGAGVNVSHAGGLAIYFPTRSVDKSYYKTLFDRSTGWSSFLRAMIQTRND